MNDNYVLNKDAERARLARHLEEFKARGGKIEKISHPTALRVHHPTMHEINASTLDKNVQHAMQQKSRQRGGRKRK